MKKDLLGKKKKKKGRRTSGLAGGITLATVWSAGENVEARKPRGAFK